MMDCRSGLVYQPEEVAVMPEEDKPYMKEMAYHPTPIQRAKRKIGRNDPCGCGSGKKFKKCCLVRAGAARTLAARGE